MAGSGSPEHHPWHVLSGRCGQSLAPPIAVLGGREPSGWLRLRRETIGDLATSKAGRALPTWGDTLVSLLDTARERQS